jgi:glutamyl-tRNA synthetase
MMLWSAINSVTGVDVPLPVYAHLPLLVDAQRKKLSKRKDPVATEMYRDQGYLAEAFVNYLALLGWSPRSGEEIVPISQCVSEFRLEDVSHSPAFFDVKKLSHINGEYIRALSLDEFIKRSAPWVTPWSCDWTPSEGGATWDEADFNPSLFNTIAPLVQERVATLGEIPAMIDFFFHDLPTLDEAAFTKSIANDETAKQFLVAVRGLLESVEWTSTVLHESVQALGESMSLSLRKAQAPLRCAVTGTLVGPPLFESLEVLGRENVLARIDAALARTA